MTQAATLSRRNRADSLHGGIASMTGREGTEVTLPRSDRPRADMRTGAGQWRFRIPRAGVRYYAL